MNRLFSFALALWLAIGGCCALMAVPTRHRECCPHEKATSGDDCTCCFATKGVSVDAAPPPAALTEFSQPIVFTPLFERVAKPVLADQSALYLTIRVLRI